MRKIQQFLDSRGALVIFFLLALSILILRRPDPLFHPQFWAEDGATWYASAYNRGALTGMRFSLDGYFQTFPRIIAAVAQFISFAMVPRFFYVVGLCVQIFPALLFCSKRAIRLVPHTALRWGIAFLYILLPNTAEVHGNITNSQWFLSLAAFLIMITPNLKTRAVQWFDLALLALSGLSGPFCFFLLPFACLQLFARRHIQTLRNVFVIAAAVWMQLLPLFQNFESRIPFFKEPAANLYFGIFSRRVVFGALTGAEGFAWITAHIPHYSVLLTIVAIAAIVLIAFAALRGPWELKLFIGFSVACALASLIFSNGYDPEHYDGLLFQSMLYVGMRYWMIPMTMFVVVLVWGLTRKNPRIIRFTSGLLLGVMSFGIIADFRHPPLPHNKFPEAVRRFHAATPGEIITIPINPPGWDMTLVKH